MTRLDITPAQRRALRAQAHALNPVVLVGDRGLAPSVLGEIERSLQAHELIKIRIPGAERDLRETMLAHVCDALGCAPVGHLGKVLIVYRPHPVAAHEPGEPLPPAARRNAQRLRAAPAGSSAQPRASGRTASRPGEPARAARRPVRGTTAAPRARRVVGSALSLRAGRRSSRPKRS